MLLEIPTVSYPSNSSIYGLSYLVLVALSWCHSKLEDAILRGYEITVELFLVNIFSWYFATPGCKLLKLSIRP